VRNYASTAEDGGADPSRSQARYVTDMGLFAAMVAAWLEGVGIWASAGIGPPFWACLGTTAALGMVLLVRWRQSYEDAAPLKAPKVPPS
jgi:hypothetical protein